MAEDKNAARKARLAAALKENLKRRKAQTRAKAEVDAAPRPRTLGTAPQAGLENAPEAGPKSAPKRN